MKLPIHIVLSDAENNIITTLQHTGVHYPTSTIIHLVEVDIPDPPHGFALDRITVAFKAGETS